MAWDKERTERLLALHREGKTAGEIGADLGVTRNAVIGKLHRMGMAKKRQAASQPEPEPEQARAVSDEATPVSGESDDPANEAPVDSEGETEDADRNSIEVHRQTAKDVEETSLRLPLMELTSRTCKWPIGDPATDEFWFCGLPSQPGKPYCAAHNNLACQPITTRRDRKMSRKPQMRPLRG